MQNMHCAAAAAVAIVLAHTGIPAVPVAGVQHYGARKPDFGTGLGEEKLEGTVEELLVFEESETLRPGDFEGLVRPKSL